MPYPPENPGLGTSLPGSVPTLGHVRGRNHKSGAAAADTYAYFYDGAMRFFDSGCRNRRFYDLPDSSMPLMWKLSKNSIVFEFVSKSHGYEIHMETHGNRCHLHRSCCVREGKGSYRPFRRMCRFWGQSVRAVTFLLLSLSFLSSKGS